METRIPAAIDALYDAWTAAGIKVWDGPIVSGDYGDAIFLAYDAQPGGSEEQAASADQEWAGVGVTRRRDEIVEITCAAVAAFGGDRSNRWKPARDRCAALIEQAGQVLRADPAIGQPPPFAAGLKPAAYYQENGPNKGMQARWVFTVRITTRV